MKSYKDLDIYKLAFQYAVEVHHISMLLPTFERYEQGSQVRRSSKSIKDNIVEGYGRRRYKQDFIKFLVYAHASLLECISQLEMMNELYPEISISDLVTKYDQLGGKIYNFIGYVEKEWKS
ncbi:MAG TPA: four helix bundle protein [Flavobacteriaceae bacterium]|nr:four helix bundle protein [Flavobacteriaceae bacterium]MAY53887.1 four helix bundle protein [Flavobacteriaceae bacterium]HBR55656.1 four helix bundle protein [Flavobacteriaceae bacterium]|tara:strand:+ start:251 stop:613 length:363 start_codon:yes stop_codon:yes gene_type:complete